MKTSKVPRAKPSVPQKEIRHAALRATGLDVSEDIANASHRSNQRFASSRVDLSAQPAHVNIHNICLWLNSHSPDPFENHRTRDHLTGVARKKFEQRKFLRCKSQRLA